MTAVIKREFRSYFHGIKGYAALAILIVFSGFLVLYYGFLLEAPTLSYVLSDLMPIVALVCPILTYKAISGDGDWGRDKVLSSLPISSLDAVLGKYLAVMLIFAIETAVLAVVPLIYNYFGEVAFASSYASLLAFFTYCASITAVYLFFSASIKKPIASLVACYGFAIVMYVLQALSFFVEKQGAVGKAIGAVISFVGIFNRFELFVYGVFDFGAIIYYLSFAAFFVFLCARLLEKRRMGGNAR